jgi:peptide-methionine (S)-S-oxide reductase
LRLLQISNKYQYHEGSFVSKVHSISKHIPDETLPGRADKMRLNTQHQVLDTHMLPPFPKGMSFILFGMGCFWGVERKFWLLPEVYTTSVGYAGGVTPNPTYEEVCSGLTGHTEVVCVVYDSSSISHNELLNIFWECHDPTQGMKQGNDRGSQYRSAIYCETEEQVVAASDSRDNYQTGLTSHGFPAITTEILINQPYYYAEEYHQQYLHKNPHGYCAMQGTGVAMRTGDNSL